MAVKNKLTYILSAVAVALVLGWFGAYDYIPDGHHGLWRINRITHQTSYTDRDGDWRPIDEHAEFDLSTARPATGVAP
jgi:hypothetical protein